MNSHSSYYAFWLCQKGGESWIDCKNCSNSTKETSKYFWTIFEQFCENFKWFYKLDFNLEFSHRNAEIKRVKYFHAINCFCHHQKGGECWFVIPSPTCFDDFYNWLENIVHFYSMWKLLLRFQKLLFTVLPLINILDKSNFSYLAIIAWIFKLSFWAKIILTYFIKLSLITLWKIHLIFT